MTHSTAPVLYVVIPCYNEAEVLPLTHTLFLEEMHQLIEDNLVGPDSRILFVDDGSKDDTWNIITGLSDGNPTFQGISLSRNRGHQNALLAGLMEARRHCDLSISIDCDGQDDVSAMHDMVKAYHDGCDIVYGVRDNRDSDSVGKRSTAQGFYRFMNRMGAETVYNHADYRLLSRRVLDSLAEYGEVNIYLRGMVPLIGFKSTSVYYARTERVAGESHYPFRKMASLALDGITSLSVKPIRIITISGFIISILSLIGIIWAVVVALTGHSVSGWASMTVVICFFGGVQMLSIGVIGEYVGKTYLESKHRPRYFIAESTHHSREDDI